MSNLLKSKRFVVRQSLIGKNTNVEVSFKNGKTITYSHDKAFEIMKESLEAMNCWEKYKSYTATNNIPKVLRETEAVISSETNEVETTDEVVETTEVEETETVTPEVAF
tara:strand:+ start:203 stop:529 length:327 start_codon:yes stop_codon:yes gene_type:complete